MTNEEILGKMPLVELLGNIRLENSVCPIRAFYSGERKAKVLSRRCSRYGYYTTAGIARGACIQCISDWLNEEEEV
jgi:hypothetical protein